MESKKKHWITIFKFACVIGLPIILQSFAIQRNNYRKIQKIDITLSQESNGVQYITNDAIESLLFSSKNAEEYALKEINVNLLEKRLDTNPMVENADIYLTIDGIMKIMVKQREPIARIAQKNQFYYMDKLGEQMPLSKASSARVPIARGITETVWKDAYLILKHIYTDSFLRENIVELIADKGLFYSRLRGADFLVCLGTAKNIPLKFNNLKAFYKKATKDQFLNKYSMVDLQYHNQVVCTKLNDVMEE